MSVIRAIRVAGARVHAVPVDEDGLQVDELESLLAKTEIKALAIQPRSHNPTGRDLSPERRERLLALVRQHGFFIVEDGIYGDLRFDGTTPRSLRADAPAHVIYADSLSKTIGGGLRAGWVAASGPVVERIVAEKRTDDIHTPTMTPRLRSPLPGERRLSGAQIELANEHTGVAWTRSSSRSSGISARWPAT